MTINAEQLPFWLFLTNIALVLIALIHMLYRRRPPQSLATWLLVIILLPFIGAIFYFIFGLRKSLSKRYKSKINMQPLITLEPKESLANELNQIMCANQIAGTTEYNQTQVITDSQQALATLLEQINHATKQIHLETYIFENDAIGKQLLDALCKKAQQGVEVRLLMDAIGSFKLYLNRKPLKKLLQAGGRYAFFQPIWPDIITSQINLRNHRKIYLFDQSILLTGGLNLSQDYLSKGPQDGATEKQHQPWIDLLFKIQGPAVFHYQNIFNEDWIYSTKEKLSTPQLPTLDCPSKGDTIQVMPAGPDIDKEPLFETLLHTIYQASNHIQIATPYFIPDNAIMHALLIALKRGVKVTLLTPAKSDHLIFDLGRSSYMRELAEAGGEVHYYHDNMLHAKLIIVDLQVALFGSANFDYRSLFINYEIVNYTYSQDSISSLDSWYQDNLKQSQIYQPSQAKLAVVFENLTRIVAPIL